MTAHPYPCTSDNCVACLRAALRDLLAETPWQPQSGCTCSHCVVVQRAKGLAGVERERLFPGVDA